MFKDYEHIGCRIVDQYEYKIIDDDFVGVGVAYGDVGLGWIGVMIGIIDCYTKRGLPVAPNLFRHMLQMRDRGLSFEQQIKWNKISNPRWHEVEKDMQLYLTFS